MLCPAGSSWQALRASSPESEVTSDSMPRCCPACTRALTPCSATQVGRVRSASSLNSLLPLMLIAYISFIPFCFQALAIEGRISECWRLRIVLVAWSKVACWALPLVHNTAVPASLAWPVLPSCKLVAVHVSVTDLCGAACSHRGHHVPQPGCSPIHLYFSPSLQAERHSAAGGGLLLCDWGELPLTPPRLFPG